MAAKALSQKRVLIGVFVLLVVTSYLPLSVGHVMWARVRHVKDVLTAPIADPLHSVAGSLRGGGGEIGGVGPVASEGWENLVYVRQLEAERDALRERLRQYERMSALAESGMLSHERVGYVPARVTSWAGRSDGEALTLNRGRSRGVSAGMVVTDGVNLVGRVTDVGQLTAVVTVLTALEQAVEVRIIAPVAEPTGQLPGIVEWDEERGGFVMTTEIQQGVEVGHLAHLADARWPSEAQGLVLGRVTKIFEDADPLRFKKLVVEPMVDLRYLTNVTVLVPMTGEMVP